MIREHTLIFFCEKMYVQIFTSFYTYCIIMLRGDWNYSIIDLNEKTDDISMKRRLVLLRRQYYWLNDNYKNICNNANKLYSHYLKKELNESMYMRCCDFKLLEEKSVLYNKN